MTFIAFFLGTVYGFALAFLLLVAERRQERKGQTLIDKHSKKRTRPETVDLRTKEDEAEDFMNAVKGE